MSDLLSVIFADRPSKPTLFVRACISGTLAAGLVCTCGCSLLQKKPHARQFVPPPIQKRPDPVPPGITDAPEIAMEAPESIDSAYLKMAIIELPAPPPPAPVVRRPPPAPKPLASVPPIPEPAAPRVIQMLTPEQSRENNKTLDEILVRVQRVLDSVSRKSLSATDKDKVEQVQGFLKQAKQAREQDLVTAVNLAKHADGLATDLLNRLP